MDFLNGPYTIEMRFDGTTEYQGQLYHNYTNTLYFDRSNQKTLTPCRPILVREDKGKVFARLPRGVYVYMYYESPTFAEEDDLKYDKDTEMSEEVQLYDFRCPVGETFTSVNNWGKKINLKVTGEETVEVGGEKLRKIRVMYVSDDSHDAGREWDIVENIGVVTDNGFFAFFNTVIATGYSDPTYMVGSHQKIGLKSYADSEGNVLFKGYDIYAPEPVTGLFREDRVWTYTSGHFMDFSNGPYIVKMRFDGTTEYGGQLYHNYTNTLYLDRSNQKTLTPCSPILVREDNGKVFARLPKCLYVSPTDYLQYDAVTGLSDEVQLYDFQCPVGETFTSINNWGEVIRIKVIGEETVEIGGENLRKIRVKYVYDESQDAGLEWDIIENIGIVTDDGFFAFFNTVIATGYTNPTYMVGSEQSISLWNYTGSNGNILYESPESTKAPLIDESKVWEYYRYDHGESEQDYTDCSLTRYRFDGTQEENGVTYHRLILASEVSWTESKYEIHVLSSPVTREVNECAALMREEDGRVYMYYGDEMLQYVTGNEVHSGAAPESREVLLYDFTALGGQKVSSYLFSQWGIWQDYAMVPATVLSTLDIESEQLGILKQLDLGIDAFNTYRYVERVGNTAIGNLFTIGGKAPEVDCLCTKEECFNNLYDRQGNLLFAGRGVKVPETQGVGGVTDENGGDGARYDLFGRRIRAAARGQVYILNGRKYVGR